MLFLFVLRGFILFEIRDIFNILWDGFVEILNIEELYKVLLLRIENFKDVNENNGWVFERSVIFFKFFYILFIDVFYLFNGSIFFKGYFIEEGFERILLFIK